MDRLERLFTAPNFFDDGVGIGVPGEGVGVVIGLGEEPVDGCLEIDDAVAKRVDDDLGVPRGAGGRFFNFSADICAFLAFFNESDGVSR